MISQTPELVFEGTKAYCGILIQREIALQQRQMNPAPLWGQKQMKERKTERRGKKRRSGEKKRRSGRERKKMSASGMWWYSWFLALFTLFSRPNSHRLFWGLIFSPWCTKTSPQTPYSLHLISDSDNDSDGNEGWIWEIKLEVELRGFKGMRCVLTIWCRTIP